MRRSVSALFAALALACGATDREVDSASPRANHCATDDDCGSGGLCYASACYARRGEAYPIVLEIVPDPSSGPSGGASFLLPPLPGLEENQPELPIALPSLVEVSGLLDFRADPSSLCPAPGSGEPTAAHLSLSRSEALPGLPKAKYGVFAEVDQAAGPGVFRFGPEALPDGSYDLYFEAMGCEAAPLLATSVKLSGSPLSLALSPPPSSLLRGTIKPPAEAPLEGWEVDLVDPFRGRVISTTVTVATGAEGAGFELAYRPVQQIARDSSDAGAPLVLQGPASTTSSPLLRIRPPKDLVAPTLLWDLAAADLSDSGHVRLDMSSLSFSKVLVTGHLEGATHDHPLVTGAIVFSSLSLSGGEPGVTASYTVAVPTDERGAYSVSLLPGQYRVVALPDPALPFAITEAKWQVADAKEHQAGRTLLVDAKPSLSARARIGAFDRPLPGATISASASAPVHPNAVLDAALGKMPALPRASSSVTDAEGRATLDLDPGLYDLWVRPPEGSWLPWLVQPRTLMPKASPSSRPVSLDLRVPLPILLGGRAYDAEGAPLRNALIRVYAKIGVSETSGPGSSPPGVVQIGEAHTAPDGRYKLLLPSKLAP